MDSKNNVPGFSDVLSPFASYGRVLPPLVKFFAKADEYTPYPLAKQDEIGYNIGWETPCSEFEGGIFQCP